MSDAVMQCLLPKKLIWIVVLNYRWEMIPVHLWSTDPDQLRRNQRVSKKAVNTKIIIIIGEQFISTLFGGNDPVHWHKSLKFIWKEIPELIFWVIHQKMLILRKSINRFGTDPINDFFYWPWDIQQYAELNFHSIVELCTNNSAFTESNPALLGLVRTYFVNQSNYSSQAVLNRSKNKNNAHLIRCNCIFENKRGRGVPEVFSTSASFFCHAGKNERE